MVREMKMEMVMVMVMEMQYLFDDLDSTSSRNDGGHGRHIKCAEPITTSANHIQQR